MKTHTHSDAAPVAKAGDTVRVHYTCRLEDGKLLDTSRGKEPLEFVIGTADIIPGLQEAVLGMCRGETKTVSIPPEKAYGPYFKEMTATIERHMVPEEVKLEPGIAIRVKHADGHESDAFVTAISDRTISVDGNHPLAGKTLSMDIELVELVPE